MMKVPWRIETVHLSATKHFVIKYMKKWDWDFHTLRDALNDAYRVEKSGENKYEIYVQRKGYKKIISVYYSSENQLLCITGSEGGRRQ